MAFFDDRKFLLSHIRHSFITCDDSGICEMALLNELMPHHLPHDPDTELLDSYCVDVKSELEPAQSLDIVSDMDMIGAHRRRSNTAQRLDRLKKERRNQAKIKVIQWRDNPKEVLSEEELNELFPEKELNKKECETNGDVGEGKKTSNKEPKRRTKSALAAQIAKFPAMPNNPFSEYSRFDGRINDGAPTKRISIFLTMLPSPAIDYPIETIIVSNASVKDLVGLICWQYTNEGKEPKLKPDVNRYCLRIAEENGDVDPDFPSLNPKEPVSKFGFPVLALVEKEEDEIKAGLVVTIHIDESFMKFEVPNLQITLKWIKEQVFKRRKSNPDVLTNVGQESDYRLESVDDPGIPLDLNTPLSEVDGREFKLIRDEDVRSTMSDPSQNLDSVLPDMSTIKATLYASYTVHAIYKFGRAEVSLGVSGQKIDVNPLPKLSTSKLWSFVPKPVSFPVDDVADFIIKRKPYQEKQTFKLVYKSPDHGFETLKFECRSNIFEDIVKQISYILRMRTSTTRGEYTSRRTSKRKPPTLFKSSSTSGSTVFPTKK